VFTLADFYCSLWPELCTGVRKHKKYPAVRLRQGEKDTAAALGEGALAKKEHLPGQKTIGATARCWLFSL